MQDKIFKVIQKSSKSMKIFSLKIFRLYGIYDWSDGTLMYLLSTFNDIDVLDQNIVI